MNEFVHRGLNRVSIRVRLTGWYVLLMALTFLLLGLFLFWQFTRSLLNSVDMALEVAVSQALSSMDNEDGRPAFQETNSTATISRQLEQSGFAIRLISPTHQIWDARGAVDAIPVMDFLLTGFRTVQSPSGDEPWRVYTQPLMNNNNEIIGWLQAAQSLEETNSTLQNMRDQLLLAIPLVLLMAGLGGYALASRALRPIDQITRTAESITTSDLTRRIEYMGPSDEVGRLARTIDHMLARLQAGFEREQRFTADAAHELRTPLSILKGQLEVSLSRGRSAAAYQTTMDELLTQVERLIRVSNGLLFLAHLEREKATWDMTSLNLAVLLDSIVEQLQPVAADSQLAIQVDLAEQLPVRGNPDQLISLFLNLLDNALKYSPPGGQVMIHGRQDEDKVRIRVQDTGPGIPPEHLPHLFERFYRVEASRSRQLGGAGLGLAIAQEIVEAHQGEIQVESEVGQGTAFVVSLPRFAFGPVLKDSLKAEK